MRAIWERTYPLLTCNNPIRVYNAIDSGQTISFNLLSKEGT